MGEPKPISARGTESSNPVPSSRQSVSRRISPSAPGEARVFRRFGGNPGRQRRQRRAKPSNIAPRRGNGRIQLIVTTRSLLAYRATLETDPALPLSDTRRVHFDRRVSPEIWRRCFRRCWWPNLDKYSAVLGLVQTDPNAACAPPSKCCDDHLSPGNTPPASIATSCRLPLSPNQ